MESEASDNAYHFDQAELQRLVDEGTASGESPLQLDEVVAEAKLESYSTRNRPTSHTEGN